MSQPVPSYLRTPYSSPRERAYAIAVVLRYWQLIEQLMKLVDIQPNDWPSEIQNLFPRSVPGGPPEHPQRRLERWLGVYADDIKILRAIRNQLVHAATDVNISDVDLRGADYLSRVMLATLFELLPSEISDDWASTIIVAISRETGL
jgi:hypothetical protein